MNGIDWLILGVYFAFVLGVGAALRRFTRTSTDFFLAGRALPAWVCGLAFISANLGAQEVIFAWTTCFVVTILGSVVTAPRRADELTGLVYSLTPRPRAEALPWYARPSVLAGTVLVTTLAINVLLW